MIKTKLLFLFIFGSIISFYVQSCDATEPGNDDENKKEFVWSEEKIPGANGVVPTDIWGSSPNEVWAVGWSESQKGRIFHYNGVEWNDVTPELGLADIYYCIYGFNPDNIYVGGYKWFILDSKLYLSALILHFDGNNWTVQIDDFENNGTIKSIHGSSPENIWAAGDRGTIYHFNGTSWQRKHFPDTNHVNSIYSFPNGQTYFVNEYSNYPTNDGWKMLYFTEYNDQGWVHIDSCKLVQDTQYNYQGYKFGQQKLWGVSIEKFLSAGFGVYNYKNKEWTIETWDDNLFSDLNGTGWGNVFAVGKHGTIHYFNGENWVIENHYSKTVVDFYSVIPFENIVYLLGYYDHNTYIIKGERK